MTLLVLLVMMGQAGDSQRAEPATLLSRAGAAYESGRFADAASLYEQVLRGGHENGHVWYNLGNSYLRSGALGDATAAYLKSRSLLPRDQDVRANLAFARKSARDAVAPPEPAAVWVTLLFWHYPLSTREVVWLLLVAAAVFWAALSMQWLRPQGELWRWAAVVAAVVGVALLGSLLARASAPTQVAVVRAPEANVNAGIGDDSVVRFKLHVGAEVRWLGRREQWLRVALPDGTQGWIDERQVIVLAL
ncbi:MAG: tetratricopeptide repeat protein [Deltaproteobacteria bacterium]|nr:tetratricopeptide repeat protein [Deltaproteobacteria bacterium]